MLRSFLWALLATGSTLGALVVFILIGEQRTPLLFPAALAGALAGMAVTAGLIVAGIAVIEKSSKARL